MTSDGSSLSIADTGAGALLRVRVSPAAGHNAITGVHDGALKISVVQAPEKGKANKEVRRVLAKAAGVRAGDIEIVSGETSRRKRVLIRGLDASALRAVLVTFCG